MSEEAEFGGQPASPETGEVANEVTAQARRDLESGLRSGDVMLEDLFMQSDSEKGEGAEHRVVGHMHVGAAIAASLNDSDAAEILSQMDGVEHNTHIDALDSDQRNELIDLMEAYE